MLDSEREKEIRLDGMQCLKKKGTKKIKNVGKHIKEERSNTYVSKLPMVVY
jgi:serine protease inhibitor ecotin